MDARRRSCFARAGASVTLVERVAEPKAIGAGIAIAENGLAVLESLGLRDALAVASPSRRSGSSTRLDARCSRRAASHHGR